MKKQVLSFLHFQFRKILLFLREKDEIFAFRFSLALLQQPLYRFAQFFSIYTLVEGNAKSTPSACMMSIMFRFRSFCICKNSA